MAETLLHRVASGDPSAMQPCIDEYGGLVWSLARRLCPNVSEAEDAVQEVFISLWENAGRFDPDKGAEVTFVAMIARRRLVDRGRRRERRRRLLDEARERCERREGDPVGTEPATVVDEASAALEAMSKLGRQQRRVLQLAIHHGYTHEQISRITDLPLGTVKTNVRRGLMRIREMLDPDRAARRVEASS